MGKNLVIPVKRNFAVCFRGYRYLGNLENFNLHPHFFHMMAKLQYSAKSAAIFWETLSRGFFRASHIHRKLQKFLHKLKRFSIDSPCPDKIGCIISKKIFQVFSWELPFSKINFIYHITNILPSPYVSVKHQ